MTRPAPLPACALLAAVAFAGCKTAVPAASDLASALITPGGPAPAADLTDAQRADVRLSLARAMEQSNDCNAAADAYEAALAEDHGHPHALHRLAVVRCRQGRPAESAALFERTLVANPGDAAVFADLGYLCLLRGDLPAAERNLRQALAVDPTHAAARGNLGLTLARRGETGEALACLRAAGAGESAGADLAFALAPGGRREEARAALDGLEDAGDLKLAALRSALGLGDAGAVVPASAETAAE